MFQKRLLRGAASVKQSAIRRVLGKTRREPTRIAISQRQLEPLSLPLAGCDDIEFVMLDKAMRKILSSDLPDVFPMINV
jgi:hypothetical protein